MCGIFQSEIYELIDATYYDDTSSDKSSNYFVASGCSITHSTDKYIATMGSTYRFIELRTNSDLLNALKGKDVKFKVTIETSTNTTVRVMVNGTATGDNSTSTDATIETSLVSIPSDATSVYFRIQGTVSSTFNFKDFIVYIV